MKDEKIVCSAIQVDGVGKKYDDIYLGLRHTDCFAAMKRRRDLLTKDDRIRVRMLQNSIQGFLTTNNRFVGREMAMHLAKYHGQVEFNHGNKNELYSEDLY